MLFKLRGKEIRKLLMVKMMDCYREVEIIHYQDTRIWHLPPMEKLCRPTTAQKLL